MRTERQFTAPMDAVEAAERAKHVLGRWKFKFWSIPGGIRFERSVPLAGLMVIHPHQVHARIDVHFHPIAGEGCQVFVKLQVFKYGQPSSNLDKMVWLGDLQDLEAALTLREEPRIDRIRQNTYAGLVTIKYVMAVIIPGLVIGGWLGFAGYPIAAIVALILVIIAVPLLTYLPFKMPHFPLESGIPPLPSGSNYPRGSSPS